MNAQRNGIRVSNPHSREAGFTIIELLTTLAVVAVGLSAAAPSLKNLSAENQVTAANNIIVSGLNLARSSAITSGNDITICPTVDGVNCSEVSWEKGWVVYNDLDNDDNADAEEVIRVVTFESQLSASGFDNQIVFQPDGTTAMGSDVTITSCYHEEADHNYCVDVNVSAFGSIRSAPHPNDGGDG